MDSSAIHHLLFLSFLPFLPIVSASNITLGSSLSAIGDNSSWISPSGEFTFGFRQLDNTNIFLLAIWYAKIPDKTIIWHANTTSPVQTESKVELTSSGLTLNSPNGQAIWQAQPDTTISNATMLDTCNFVLSSSTNSSVYVLQSFSYPTDTILPTQVLSLGGMLYSRLTETNYSNGRFELHFMNGALELKPVAWPSRFAYNLYYSSGTASTNSSESGLQLVFNQSVDIYIVRGNGSTVKLSWPNNVPNYANNYHRATLDFDGVFRQYTYPKTSVGNQSWSVVRYIPGDICMELTNDIGSGACGFNSYCVENSGIPSCQCPPGFLFTDPNNKFGGCQPNFLMGCGVDDGSRKPEDLYDLHKRLPLSNGRVEGAVAIIKVRKGVGVPSLGNDPYSYSKKENHILLWSILFGGSGLFNILLLVIVSLVVFSQQHKKWKKTIYDSNVPETNLRIFTFEELNEATQGFTEELGMGSFGIVYKGTLKFGSKNQVAVKRLDKLSKEGEREFKTEVSAIGKTHHKNLVQLIGYCDEGPQRQYQRTQVALGIARGLVYLHEECDAPIIHCDIKPQNILINEYFTA
ncbi:hypothetical protein ACSBR1_038393 [Camellia fascicularis]